MARVGPATTDADRDRIVGAGCGDRVHAIEYGWLEAMRNAVIASSVSFSGIRLRNAERRSRR